jgi:hypothetical protein
MKSGAFLIVELSTSQSEALPAFVLSPRTMRGFLFSLSTGREVVRKSHRAFGIIEESKCHISRPHGKEVRLALRHSVRAGAVRLGGFFVSG